MTADLLKGLTAQTRAQAANEAARLVALLPELGPMRALLEQFLPAKGRAGEQRPSKDANPLVWMLLTAPLTTVPDHALLDALRGWCLVATLRFCAKFSKTDQHARPREGLRAIRRIVAGKYGAEFFSELRPEGLTARALLKAIRRLEGDFKARQHPRAVQLGNLALLLSSAIVEKPPRAVAGARHRSGGHRPEDQTLALDDMTATLSAEEDLAADAPPEEVAESLRIKSFTWQAQAGYSADRLAAQLDLLAFEDEAVAFGGAFAALTAQEARAIATAALRDARAGQGAAGLILASLVSGRSVEVLAQAGALPLSGATWLRDGQICFASDVTFAPAPERHGFALSVPVAWSRDVAGARAWLSKQGLERVVPLARIARALPDAMAGEDSALVGLLCGESVILNVPLYYARFPLIRLDALWRETLLRRFGLEKGFSVTALDHRTVHVGSLSGPELKAISQWFAGLIRAAEEARERLSQGLGALPLVTAAEANLAASILAFQTARRPHGFAFEPLGQVIGQHRPRVRLTGKGGRQVDDGRWVPLGVASLEALALWRGALARLRALGALDANYALGEMVRAVEAGRAPAFFAWDSWAQEPSALLAPALFRRVGAPVLPRNKGQRQAEAHGTPSNWARHVVRRELAARGISGTATDGFMGHGGAAADPLAQVSAATVAGQDALRKVLDEIWDALDVHVPEPWQ